MKRFTIQTILFFFVFAASGHTHRLAILDLSERNLEINKENLASAIHMSEVAGMPYIITKNTSEAIGFPFILVTSPLKPETLTLAEIDLITDYVSSGGILIAPFISNEHFFNLFGISNSISLSTRYWLRWNTTSSYAEMQWINEDLEKELPLADSEYYRSIYTRGYSITQANVLAAFEDNSAAITLNNFGTGKAYALGFELKDVVLRNLMNKDYNAHRTYSNGFEPTTDMFLLFLRAVYTSNQPVAIYKHTSPAASTSALLITHDVDSETGIDSMYYFSDWEANRGIKAHYFVTTRYFSDALMGNFYNEAAIPKFLAVKANGHSFGSHSVGHFPDFADRTLFPEGETGNTPQSYQPRNNGTYTIGGSVTGELEVSRSILNADLAANVRSFRAGHLAFNLNLINVMERIHYAFNSSQSANDVLTNFPYRQRTGSAFSGIPTNVYEMPMTISDASKALSLTEETIDEAAANWLQVVEKNNNNNAPTVLLIHPNRSYKVKALEKLIDALPNTVKPMAFDDFGDYWLQRRDLDFDYAVSQNNLQIHLLTNDSISADQSLIIKGGKQLNAIKIFKLSGEEIFFTSVDWKENDVLLFAIGSTEYSAPPAPIKAKVRLAILDLTETNGETNKENLSSAQQMAQVAGIPFHITTSLEEALNERFILLSSQIDWETFSSEQLSALKSWVSDGGVLIAPFVKHTDLFSLFGIATTKLDQYRYTLNWVQYATQKELKWINDPMEQSLPLAKADYYKSIYTRGYTVNTATPLAFFEDNKVAVCRNNYGLGKAYAFGVQWQDIILRNLLDKDYNAQRISLNGFEPTTDVFMLVLRAIFTENQTVSVYKHSSPGESTSALLITHDVDSRTIIDTMHYFSNWEFVEGISAHYFVTTHYFKDLNMSAYYEASKFEKIQELIQRNHTIGSHSVGHFPDFAKTSVFPKGVAGNTAFNYHPIFNGSFTEAGTVYGELEVSKNLLTNDIGTSIRSFRAGALAFNPYLINVMADLDYSFNSSVSANNVLTNFPYFQRSDKAFSGHQTNVLEIPLTVSDVSPLIKLESTNIDQVVAVWTDVIARNAANNAPSVLLLSTNRGWKLEALQNLIAGLPQGVISYNFEDYGDYWLDRTALDFDYYLSNDTLLIQLNRTGNPAEDLSLMIENGNLLTKLIVRDNLGTNLTFYTKNWNSKNLIITFGESPIREQKSAKIDIPALLEESTISIFPNPAKDYTNLLFELDETETYQIQMTDLNGRLLFHVQGTALQGSTMQRIDLPTYSKGMYLIHFKSESIQETLKLFISE
jgi:peptidoglycan/xylan/chitin deacetylase (PgdA/CDA1 family)